VAVNWFAPGILWWLLLVPLLIALFVWGWRSRIRATQRFGSTVTARQMVAGRSAWFRAAKAVLLIIGIALAIVAMARPRYGSHTRMLRKRGVDVVVVLDFSKRMLATDVRPNRIERAKAEVSSFISKLGGDRIGIVAFAGETMEFPMTVDYAASALFFRDMGPYDMPVGGTAIGRALVAAKRLLERSSREEPESKHTDRARVVILMTDGEDHEGDPLEAAKELAGINAVVHVVAIGSRAGEPIPTYAEDGTWTGYQRDEEGNPVLTALTEKNENQLKEIAKITGGKYFRARRGSVGMDQIRKEMGRMKQSELKARLITVHEERYALILLVAFLLVVLEALLPEAWIGNRQRKNSNRSWRF